MKTDKQKIIDYAKDLYLQYDSEGRKVFSLRDIVEKLLQEGYKKVTHQTIKRWSEKYDWNKLNEKVKQHSISKAEKEKLTTEEQIIEKESDKLAETYKNAESLEKVGFAVVFDAYKGKENKLISTKDALTAIKLGTDIKLRILSIPESETIQNVKINMAEITDEELQVINDKLENLV